MNLLLSLLLILIQVGFAWSAWGSSPFSPAGISLPPASYEVFASGWLRNEGVIGRPVDLEILDDGSMLVSDDHAGRIYRITYQP